MTPETASSRDLALGERKPPHAGNTNSMLSSAKAAGIGHSSHHSGRISVFSEIAPAL